MTNANCNIFQKLWKKIIKGKFIFKQFAINWRTFYS